MKERYLFVLVAALTLLAATFQPPYVNGPISHQNQAGEIHSAQPVAIGASGGTVDLPPISPGPAGLAALTAWLQGVERGEWLQRLLPGLASNPVDVEAPFFVSRLELLQAVQNLEAPVPLIAGKPVIVRAYVESQGIAGPIWGALYASADNGRTWMTITPENSQPVTAVITGDRYSDDHALRFILSGSLAAGELLLSIESYLVTGEDRRQSDPVAITFTPASPLRIAYLGLGYENAWPEAERINRAHTYMQMIYPLAEVDYFPLPYMAAYRGDRSAYQAIHFLRRLHALYEYTGWPVSQGGPDQLFGWAPHSTWRLDGRADPDWFNNGGSQLAFGTDSPVNKVYQIIMAHEIGHNLGLQHPVCGQTGANNAYNTYAIQDVGFDFGFYATASPLVHPATDDFMVGSHCRADIYENKWISANKYQKLYDNLFHETTDTHSWSTVAAGQPVYLVGGQIYSDGRAGFDTVYRVTPAGYPLQRNVANYCLDQENGRGNLGGAQCLSLFRDGAAADISDVPAVPLLQRNGSDYCLVLENSQGETISSHCFDLSLDDVARYLPGLPAMFVYALPDAPGVARLALLRHGRRLAERTFSAHAPTVEISGPAPGSSLPDRVELTWNGRDPDGDPLTYIVSYSPDGGGAWYHLAHDYVETRLSIDVTELPGGGQAFFRVMASDGLRTAVAMTGPFHIENRPPQAFILLPDEDSSFRQGQTLLLSGYGYDAEDGALDGVALHWSSDLAGYLGNGKTLTINDLPAGRHTITLLTTDSVGQSVTTTIQIQVD